MGSGAQAMFNLFVHNFQFFAASCSKPTLFGIPSWYSYLQLKYSSVTQSCEIVGFQVPGDFLLVGLAILDILLHIAALVAVGFVIYGSIQLITSRGEPDKAAQGRQTIINALVGLVITLIAVGVVAFLGRRLG